MKFLMTGTITVALLLAMVATTASAQYPPPGEAIDISISDPNPDPGETITLEIVIGEGDDTASAGGEGAAVQLASLQTTEGPPYSCSADVTGGEGATVSPSDFTTDDTGRASLELYTGTEDALLTVSVTCGELSSQVMVPVGQVDTPTETPPPGTTPTETPPPGTTPTVTPPSGTTPVTTPAPGTTPGPPETGSGMAGDDGGASWAWLIVIAPAVALGLAGTALAIRRRA